MTHSPDDTICAIATPVGEGGIGIIRVSGARALDVAARIVRPRNRASLQDLDSHRLYVSDVVVVPDVGAPNDAAAVTAAPDTAAATVTATAATTTAATADGDAAAPPPSAQVIDEALVVVMRRPRSYTGETVVEIQTHGGAKILHTTCHNLVRHGARLAQPGEFTKRAFLNGRLDLAQAEAVLDTIHATTTRGLQAAQALLRGALSREIDALRDRVLRVLAHLEAGMDFVEDEVVFIHTPEMRRALDETQQSLARLIDSYDEGRLVRDGITVAIIGRPNVGKSSLLNALLNMERVIVSELPGTTRDVVEESLHVGGVALRVLDTAGLRRTRDGIEAEGIRRTETAIADADALLLVIDGAAGMTDADRALLDTHGGRRCLLVVNKMDLPGARARAMPDGRRHGGGADDVRGTGVTAGNAAGVVPVSAKTGEGLDRLKSDIRNLFVTDAREAAPSVLVTRLRHRSNLERARAALDEARSSLDRGEAGECVALDLRATLDALGEITGTVGTEDVLDRIFQDFCIGK